MPISSYNAWYQTKQGQPVWVATEIEGAELPILLPGKITHKDDRGKWVTVQLVNQDGSKSKEQIFHLRRLLRYSERKRR